MTPKAPTQVKGCGKGCFSPSPAHQRECNLNTQPSSGTAKKALLTCRPLPTDPFPKAKGLQAPVVILANPSRGRTHHPAPSGKSPGGNGKDPERAEWGIIIHAGLEFLIKNTPPGGEEKALMEVNLQGLAEKLVGQQKGSSWQAEEVLQSLKDITRSSLWKRVWASRERYGEVPFGIWEGDTFINGTIDLAFREGEGWILVDYKTDVLEDDKHLEELVEYYDPQLEIYQKYWERITGERVREGGFFFTHKGAYEKL